MENKPETIIPVAFNPHNHIAVICARKGIDLGKTGRNEPCPCGSGTKFKKCCIEQTPEKLCYRFSLTDTLFHNANCDGDTKRAEELANGHNQHLAVLKILDPGTFKNFEPLKAG